MPAHLSIAALAARARSLAGWRARLLSFAAGATSVLAMAPFFAWPVLWATLPTLREAAERGITPIAHLQHLVVHGVLHLLGFEHETDAGAEDMQSIETEIIAALGVSDPYA